MNLEQVTLQVINLTKAIGAYIRNESQKISEIQIEEKGLHDLVSYVDKEAENSLVGELGKIIPGSGFIVEENQTLQQSDEFNWIIDPLDGTTNFLHGVPVFSISIALLHKQELVLGVVYEIMRDECFYSWKGGKAFLNGNPISVTSTSLLDDSLIATGFPYSDYSLVTPYVKLFEDLMKNTRGIRRLGSAAVDLAYVACGRFDLFFEYSLNPWDVAAGAFIVQQAGGRVTDFKAGDNFLYGRQIIACNPILHQTFYPKLENYFSGLI